ncbi:MAG: transposase [Bacteroidetes bacterium]|nr:transposase [Bacteroidota bacterium]
MKAELIWKTIFMTREQAKREIASYIDGFYNQVRRHSTLGFTSPVKLEKISGKKKKTSPLFPVPSNHNSADVHPLSEPLAHAL